MPKINATTPKGNQLSDEDYKEFEQAINEAWSHEDELRTNEATFIEDLMRRYEMYGRRVFVTEAQLDWLLAIAERVA